MTTTNPSLAVDNDVERRYTAIEKAQDALSEASATWSVQLATLEDENARLRAALTEADHWVDGGQLKARSLAVDVFDALGLRDEEPNSEALRAIAALKDARAVAESALAESERALEVSLNTTAETLERAQRAEFSLAESERARAILAKQLDEECARLPRLRQEQTAEIERLKEVIRLQRVEGALRQGQTARIADLEAEVEQAREYAKALAEHNDRAVAEVARMMLACRESTEILEQIHLGDPAASLIDRVCEMLTSAYQGGPEDSDDSQPAPALAPAAVPVIEPGSRWRREDGVLARVDTADDVFVSYCLCWHSAPRLRETRASFLAQWTHLPDEPAGGGEP